MKPASLVIASCAACLLVGCVSLDPKPDSTRFYTLGPVTKETTAEPAAAARRRVGVRVTAFADYLQRPEVAVRVSEHELRFPPDERWAERVDFGVERTIAAGLQQRSADLAVLPVGSASAATLPVVIDVTLTACEGSASGSALLAGYWKITTTGQREPVASGQFQRRRDGWDGRDFAQLAGMLSALADELAGELSAPVRAAAP